MEMVTPTYCQRYRMEVDLHRLGPVPSVPMGYVWVPWADEVLGSHADVEWRSFQGEFDTQVFPNLGRLDGCLGLMHALRELTGFVTESAWLIEAPDGCCGAIQGIRDEAGIGMIQNIGVVPEHRGCGLGRALLVKSLHGLRKAGLKRTFLEVSARNHRAIRLYHQTGFVIRKTFYRKVVGAEQELPAF